MRRIAALFQRLVALFFLINLLDKAQQFLFNVAARTRKNRAASSFDLLQFFGADGDHSL